MKAQLVNVNISCCSFLNKLISRQKHTKANIVNRFELNSTETDLLRSHFCDFWTNKYKLTFRQLQQRLVPVYVPLH